MQEKIDMLEPFYHLLQNHDLLLGLKNGCTYH